MKYDPVAIGKHLAILRHSNGLTIVDLAKKVFSNRQTISCIEKGKTQMSLEFLYRLSDVYGCNVSYLLNETVEPIPSNWVVCDGITYCKHCGTRAFANQKTKYCGTCGAKMKNKNL